MFLDTGSRILILDGAMGTMVQKAGLKASEALNLERPDVILNIHRAYIEAGADIIETNSFGANRISQAEFGLADRAPLMACQAAVLARQAAMEAAEDGRKVLVAGSVGPTGKSLTLATNPDDPTERPTDFETLANVYAEQMRSLLQGGVDLILLETWFDALNAKAAISAFSSLGAPVPLIISATVSDRSGRMLTGQTLEAFYHSVRHAPGLAAFGINCALGAEQMSVLARQIAGFSDLPLIFFPNAGIPDGNGLYPDTPEDMAAVAAQMASDGILNIIGGCCGTTPDHIKAMAQAVNGKAPRKPGPSPLTLTVSGLEAYHLDANRNFTNIGERTNVAGSRKFARIISEGKYDEALGIAAAQIEGGADVIDINMDDPMLDPTVEMQRFLRCVASDPNVSRAAVMIDSSRWETIEEALRNVPGRSIVNSISLKDGEEEFVRRARHIHGMGAAMVVMAFDEQGQATTFGRKKDICERAYRLLLANGIPAEEIIFDVNVLSIGTGIPEHSRFGVDFIEAVRWIKENLPGALTSGGISNLSFAFRGNNAVREAMHSAFLYHAVKAGLDMAIVNPQMLLPYDAIEPDLRQKVEDVIFDSRPDATALLVEKAARMLAEKDTGNASAAPADARQECGDPVKRLSEAVVAGGSRTLESDTLEAVGVLGGALQVVEGPLMQGMETVGERFADGRMFLPQVVKSAKVMRDAVAVLGPYMKADLSASRRPRFVIATVQGDVHDIGKNITATVLQCSGFEVIDLGVMVPSADIIAKAEECGAAFIGVSGLITPSLSRMEELCRMLADKGSDIPLFVGGAAASAVHTAVRLAEIYPNVHYGADASATAVKAKRCLADRGAFDSEESASHQHLRELHASKKDTVTPRTGIFKDYVYAGCVEDIPLRSCSPEELEPYLDWKLFLAICGVRTNASDDRYGAQLMREASEYLRNGNISAVLAVRFFEAFGDGSDIALTDGRKFPVGRLRSSGRLISEYFPAPDSGRAAVFGEFAAKVDGSDDDLVHHAARAIMADAASSLIREELSRRSGKDVIMPGIGYSCIPDHSLKKQVLDDLAVGIGLTESFAMIPEASVCGLVIFGPKEY